MIYGLDASHHRGLIAGGDSHGAIHFIDARSEKPVGTHQMHKKGNKVVLHTENLKISLANRRINQKRWLI